MDCETDFSGHLLLDVREAYEFASGAIPGAVNIPWTKLAGRMGQLDPNTPIVTVCNYGYRSGKAAELLAIRGYAAVVLEGGIKRWKRSGRPLVRADV